MPRAVQELKQIPFGFLIGQPLKVPTDKIIRATLQGRIPELNATLPEARDRAGAWLCADATEKGGDDHG